jgi:Mrp family chromosome partitioning ATPase
LAWAETVYHQILIDSPPILAASDSTIIGRMADGLVLVVQPAKNHRRMVLRAVDAIRSFGVQLVGVAVNRMSRDRERDDEGLDSAYREEYAGEDYGDDPEEDDAETFAVQFVPHSDEIERPALRRAA